VLKDNLRVLIMCCDGLYQRYLINRVKKEFNLVGVIFHATPNAKGNLFKRIARYRNPIDLLTYLQARILIPYYESLALPLVKRLFFENGCAPLPPNSVPICHVGNVNAPEAVKFVHDLAPDIICVNGTNLLREPMLNLIPTIPFGIINLHTGLSPYARGGNCNLFVLLEGHPELVGITIHHIDKGIDSGDIIITARPEMEPTDNYEMIDAKTFRLGIDLMLVAIHQLIEGRAERVKQWEEGRLFLRRTGYVYYPYLRVKVNLLLKKGLIRDYLKNRQIRDIGIQLVGKQV